MRRRGLQTVWLARGIRPTALALAVLVLIGCATVRPVESTAPPRLSEYGNVTGKVTDPAGRPIPGAYVDAEPVQIPIAIKPVSRDGTYDLAYLQLEPGSYTVYASADGYRTETVVVRLRAGQTIVIDFVLPPCERDERCRARW